MSYIDDYLGSLEEPNKQILSEFVTLVRKLVPEREEVKSYGIPTFKYRGKSLVHFAAYKEHMSVYPGSRAINKYADELSSFKISKGTVQFTKDNRPSNELLIKIILLNKHVFDESFA